MSKYRIACVRVSLANTDGEKVKNSTQADMSPISRRLIFLSTVEAVVIMARI
jgi:hypothetical protein